MPKQSISTYEHVFPVVGFISDESLGLRVKNVFGTSFPLGGGYFMTAEHVVTSAQVKGKIGIGHPDHENWLVTTVSQFEVHPELDLAIFRAEVPKVTALSWIRREIPMLTEVQACGFPYALDPAAGTVTIRAFRGYVVTSRTWHSLSAKPRIYELQFMCPRGISGGPLWVRERPLTVAGVVFGNSITEMTVFKDEEIEEEGGKRTVYERREHLHLGVAVEI